MVGLKKNNYLKIFNLFYQLFVRKSFFFIYKSYFHWLNVEYIGLFGFNVLNLYHSPLEWLFNYIYMYNCENDISKYHISNLILKLDCFKLVFVNGYLNLCLSDNNIEPWVIHIENDYNSFLSFKSINTNIFVHLIECLTKQFVNISLIKNVKLIKPLYILHINDNSFKNRMLQSYFNINIKPNSSCFIIEHFISISNTKYFINSKTNFNLCDNSFLNHIKLISENNLCYNISNNDVFVNYNSSYFAKIFFLGTNYVKYYINVKFKQINSSISVVTFTIPTKYSVVDINSFLYHQYSYCYSYQLHKVITIFCSKFIFHGLIKVGKNIINNKSLMINNNLLLNNLSEIISNPKLEIYSSNVICNHAVTVGFLDENQIFYFLSRGIKYFNTLQIIIYSFVFELIKDINFRIVFSYLILRIANFLNGFSYFYDI